MTIRDCPSTNHGPDNVTGRRRVTAARLFTAMLTGACFAFAAATPSLAQSYDPDFGSGNIVAGYGQTAAVAGKQRAPMAYAQVRRAGVRRARTNDGRLFLDLSGERPSIGAPENAGTDPDPNIRFQLYRESLQGRW